MTARSHDSSLEHPPELEPDSDRLGPDSPTNVGRLDRAISAALGGALLVRGLRRRSLGGALTALAGGALAARGVSGHSRLYRKLDVNTAVSHEPSSSGDGMRTDAPTVERSITVGEPADELDSFWREPEQLSRLVGHFADVTGWGDDRYNWRARGPFGRVLEWDTQLVADEPGESLRWETLEGAMIPHEGTVEFRPAPGDQGTEVTLRMEYEPPGGALGDAAMHRLGAVPEALAGKTLRRFKSLAETGEIPTLEGNPSARGKGDLV